MNAFVKRSGGMLLTLVMTSWAAAQMPVEVDGTIMSIEGTIIFVRDAKADQVFRCDMSRNFRHPTQNAVYVMPNPVSIKVTGTEEVGNLRVGMNLQFEVILANKRTAVSEVESATVFASSPVSPLGVMNSEAVDAPATVADDEKAKGMKYEKCLLAGTITKIKKETITLIYPNEKGILQTLNIRMKDDAKLAVMGDTLAFARVGDKIHATGEGWIPLHFLAREINIEHFPVVDIKAGRLDKPELVDKIKPFDKTAARDPFGVGDPEDKKPPAMPVKAKAKVKLEVVKVN